MALWKVTLGRCIDLGGASLVYEVRLEILIVSPDYRLGATTCVSIRTISQ